MAPMKSVLLSRTMKVQCPAVLYSCPPYRSEFENYKKNYATMLVCIKFITRETAFNLIQIVFIVPFSLYNSSGETAAVSVHVSFQKLTHQ